MQAAKKKANADLQLTAGEGVGDEDDEDDEEDDDDDAMDALLAEEDEDDARPAASLRPDLCRAHS